MSDQHAAPPSVEHAAHEEGHPYVNYWIIFAALCVLTVVSWLADELGHKGRLLVVIVLAVACCKALFVMMYFMHLKFEGKWKFVLLAPTIVLAMAIPAALMPDIGSHYYDYQVPQLEEDAHASPPAAPADGHGAAPKHH
ncbi:MAG: cytochrome C oxidase subunit IV family protein [Planctomycetia bacterium]|nr:cytochrome C oxidase subunit IV family protein [Planctomycetia bacterium]